MELKTKEEKRFNWIKGYEGNYLMNEDKQIKTGRVTTIVGNKREVHEATFVTPYLNEEGKKEVMLMNDTGKITKHLTDDLEVIQYKRTKGTEPKT